jgi:hypothetical protein
VTQDGTVPPDASVARAVRIPAPRPAASVAKAADDLAKAVERGPDTGPAVPSVGAADPAEAGAGDMTWPEGVGVGVDDLLLGDTATVPQATWTPGAAADERVARLSDAPDRSARGVETPGAASGPPATRPRATEPAVAASPRGSDAAGQRSVSAPPRIVVHYRGGSDASVAQRVAAELRARGYARTELRPVSFAVSQANVRYFHDQNRPVAREVNKLVGSMWRRSQLRDFTHYAPLPAVGTVEVWLPG